MAKNMSNRPRRRYGLPTRCGVAGAVLLLAVIVLAGCGSDDPAAVLADYLEVWNSEDADAVMVFYTDDAVIEGHPADPVGLATGKSEIRIIETAMKINQGSTGTLEFVNMEVSGNTVTFDRIFHNGSGECFSGTPTVMTVDGDKIARMVWGRTDADLC